MPHIRTDPTPFRVVAGSKPRASYPRAISHFTILHFYLGRPRILQSSYTSRRLADRIRITVLEYGSGPLPYLGRSRMLQSSYTSRRWQIASAYGGRYGSGDKEDGSYLAKGQGYPDRTRSSPKAIGIPAYDRQCSGAALPRRRPEGDSTAIRRLSGRSQGGSYAIS
jgi:hypothetical protein